MVSNIFLSGCENIAILKNSSGLIFTYNIKTHIKNTIYFKSFGSKPLGLRSLFLYLHLFNTHHSIN